MADPSRESRTSKWLQAGPVRDGVLSGLAVFAAALGSLLWLNHEAGRNQSQLVRESMARMARGVAQLVDGGLHEEVVRSRRMNSEEYKRAVMPLVEFHRGVPEIAYLYTLIERGDRFFFVLDTATEQAKLGFQRPMEVSSIMEPYEIDPAVKDIAGLEALRRGDAFVSKHLYSDEYGTFLTALAPIRDKGGEITGFVGLDVSMEDYLQRMQGLKDAAIVSVLIAAITGALLGGIVWAIRRKSIHHQAESWQAMAQKTEIEERDRRLIQAIGQIIYMQNLDNDIIVWTGDCEKLVGIPPEKMAGTTDEWLERVHPADRERVRKSFERALNDQPLFDSEYRYLGANGSYKWFHDRGMITRNVNGYPLSMDGILLDVTDRKLSDERFRTVFECSTDPHLLVDESGVIDCNIATVEILGYSDKSEIIGQPLEKFWPEFQPDGRRTASVLNEIGSGTSGQRVHRLEMMKKHATGELFPVEVSNTYVSLGGRNVMLVVWHDLRKIKQAQRDLLASEQKYRELVENLEPIVFQTDTQGNWVFLNPAWEKTTGFSVKGSIHRACYDYVSSEDVGVLAAVLEISARQNASRFKLEFRVRCKSGEVIWLEGYGHRRFDSTGRIVGLAGTLSNVTVRKETEGALIAAKESAEAADRAKGEFLAVMSHEIRTPMNGVIGFTQLLKETRLTVQQEDYVDTIRSCGDSLLHLLNDVLDFSKMESGNLQMESVPFSLRQCIGDVMAFYAPAASSKGIDLIAVHGENLCDWILGDTVRFRQIVMNLLGNAVKFTEAGKVELRLDCEGRALPEGLRMLHVEVSDTGIGITEDKLPLLFKPFSQADSSTTRKYGGTGLGLAICSRLVAMLGGKLEVESQTGKGSRFSFKIPLKEASRPDAVPASFEPVPVQRSLRILLVEDNSINRRVLAHMLGNLGYKTNVAVDGFECLSALERQEYDLVFMDVQMPGLDGFETTARLRAEGRSVWICALTAAAMPDDRLKCQIAGMNDYMTKPFTKQQLAAAIERCLAANRTSDSA